MKASSSRRPDTGLISSDTAGDSTHADHDRRFRQGPRPRARGDAARRAGGGSGPVLPPPGVAGGARGRDGGRAADHARLEQLPRADRRSARAPGRPRRARALRHRPDRLAPAQRHDRSAPRARGRARRLDGHRGRDRLHHRPPGQPRLPGDDPRAGRHRRRRLGRPRLDPRRLPALAGQAARLPPQPARPPREDAGQGRAGRRRDPRGRRWRLLDGGRRRAPAPDRRAVPALRRAADGRRGARARRARRPRGRHRRAARRRGRGPTCGWRRSRSRWPRAAG